MISTVVGNFPKVGDSHEEQKLRRAVEAHQYGKITLEELERIQDEVTQRAIEEQIAAGIQLITDGQIRWIDPLTWLARKLKGISISGLIRFFDNNVYYRQPVVEAPVGWQEPILVADYEFTKKVAGKRAEVKVVLPGPYTLAKLSKNNHYGRFEDLVFDFAKALAQEAAALEKAGAKFVQFDEPSLAFHPENIQMAEKALKICTDTLKNAKVALYLYFGGVSKVFGPLQSFPVHVLGIDLVSDPENIALLKNTVSTKELALGIVDARNTKLEKEEECRTMIRALEKNGEQIQYVNPSAGLEFLPRDIAVQKLKLIGSLAGLVKQAV